MDGAGTQLNLLGAARGDEGPRLDPLQEVRMLLQNAIHTQHMGHQVIGENRQLI
jgi:hypothetical protein